MISIQQSNKLVDVPVAVWRDMQKQTEYIFEESSKKDPCQFIWHFGENENIGWTLIVQQQSYGRLQLPLLKKVILQSKDNTTNKQLYWSLREWRRLMETCSFTPNTTDDWSLIIKEDKCNCRKF